MRTTTGRVTRCCYRKTLTASHRSVRLRVGRAYVIRARRIRPVVVQLLITCAVQPADAADGEMGVTDRSPRPAPCKWRPIEVHVGVQASSPGSQTAPILRDHVETTLECGRAASVLRPSCAGGSRRGSSVRSRGWPNPIYSSSPRNICLTYSTVRARFVDGCRISSSRVAPPCSGPFSAPIAAHDGRVDVGERRCNHTSSTCFAFNSWSACRISATSSSRVAVSDGFTPSACAENWPSGRASGPGR